MNLMKKEKNIPNEEKKTQLKKVTFPSHSGFLSYFKNEQWIYFFCKLENHQLILQDTTKKTEESFTIPLTLSSLHKLEVMQYSFEIRTFDKDHSFLCQNQIDFQEWFNQITKSFETEKIFIEEEKNKLKSIKKQESDNTKFPGLVFKTNEFEQSPISDFIEIDEENLMSHDSDYELQEVDTNDEINENVQIIQVLDDDEDEDK
ncbi:hypothetical protein M0811_00189 [Anaeramoeba ignava]|uniref:PH domain-containing protein n=1 Tax=Anaeramoeba ignava TaxID=1746090 RepID=A0A9Q0RDQ8_ANAIG|nr:hypothetical protein M0811_00189 [Anaeramoeba ignava]